MTAFNKTLPMPLWLRKRIVNANTRRGQRYYRRIWFAQPPWANIEKIRFIYRVAKQMRKDGVPVEVDHIVPLVNPYVCGLHTEQNITFVHRKTNSKKSNHTFPNSWTEQKDLLYGKCDS